MPEAVSHLSPRVGVCLVSPYSPSRVTGIGRFIQDIARQLKAAGSSAFMIHPDPPASDQSLDDESLTLRFRRFKDLELAARTAFRLIRRRNDYRVVHVQQVHIQSAMAEMMARILGIPSVLTLHLRSPPAKQRFQELLDRVVTWVCISWASARVAVSEPTATAFRDQRIVVIENGIDPTMFAPSQETRERIRRSLGGLDDAVVFAFAGRWSLHKGFDLLLQALRLEGLPDKMYHLLVLGSRSADEPDLLEDNLSLLDRSNRVHVLGPVESVSDFLNASDVLILPSRDEGMPLIFLEAEAVGLPVLASDIPIHRFLQRRSGCGWTFKSGNANDLAKVMAGIIANGFPREWRERARQSILQYNSLETMVRNYAAIYTRLSEFP